MTNRQARAIVDEIVWPVEVRVHFAEEYPKRYIFVRATQAGDDGYLWGGTVYWNPGTTFDQLRARLIAFRDEVFHGKQE